jgi:hypothetical protein
MEQENNPISLSFEDKIKVFEKELKQIKNEKLRQWCTDEIGSIPDWFFNVAASSTGKYHPSYALGQGGLVRHTIAATEIAIGLFPIMNLTEIQQDEIICALLLHDSFKHGSDDIPTKYTVAEHPVLIANYIKSTVDVNDPEIYDNLISISSLVLTHMGQWNTDYKTKRVIMPKPQTAIQNFVHMCDYLASRKYLDFIFSEVK